MSAPRPNAVRTAASAAALALTLALSGCMLLPFPGPAPVTLPPAASEPSPAATRPPSAIDPDAPFYSSGELPPPGVAPVLEADPPLTVMTPELFQRVNTAQGLTFARSTPAGTWPVGKGFPSEFPIGLPVFPDRWVKDGILAHENQGRLGLSFDFWGGYDDVAEIVAALEELGYDVTSEILQTRQAHVAEGDDYRVVITVAEGVESAGAAMDPMYTVIVVFRRVPWEGG